MSSMKKQRGGGVFRRSELLTKEYECNSEGSSWGEGIGPRATFISSDMVKLADFNP